MLEIKYPVSLKIESSHFWTRVHFKGGAKSSKILREVAHKEGGGGLTDLEFFGWARKKGVRSILQGGADTLKDTM